METLGYVPKKNAHLSAYAILYNKRKGGSLDICQRGMGL